MNMNVRKAQGGFTLIELVIVIVILGIMAAIAIPRFIDLTEDAEAATCSGISGALLSNAAILLADPDSGDPVGTGNPANLADIHTDMTKDGWTADEETAGCTITATLDNGTECAATTIPAELAADC